MLSLRHPGGFSRLGLVRRWWHYRVLNHMVARTVVRDTRLGNGGREFFFKKGWVCIDCQRTWG